MKLYQFAILWHPTKQQREKEGMKSEVVVEVQTVVAKDESHAAMLAARAIPEDRSGQLDQLEVAIRPF